MEQAPEQTKQLLSFPEGVKVPEGLRIATVPLSNPFMHEAARLAAENAFEDMTVTATVLVKDGQVIGAGINGDGFHQKHERCLRAHLPAGEGYETCPGCHPDNHSERVAIKKAQEAGQDTHGAHAYLYGHFWSCESCMQALVAAGVGELFLLEDARRYFDRSIDGATERRRDLEERIRQNTEKNT